MKKICFILIMGIFLMTGCSKSSSVVNINTNRIEFNDNIFRDTEAKLVYNIEYSIGGMDFVNVSDDSLITDIIRLLQNLDLKEKAPQDEPREGGTIIRITTSKGIISFGFFGAEILGDGIYYEIDEDKGEEIMEYLRQLMRKML